MRRWAIWVLAGCAPTEVAGVGQDGRVAVGAGQDAGAEVVGAGQDGGVAVGAGQDGGAVAGVGQGGRVAVGAGQVVGAAVPELPQVWSAPEMQHSLAAVDGGAGIVGRVSRFPETIARVDARTGAEVWRVDQPGEVMWTTVRVGVTHAAVAGRLPARGGDRVGYVDLRDGKLLWDRGVAERGEVVIGLDGTGVGLRGECELTVLDPTSGRAIDGTLRGRTIGVGHSGPDGPQVHPMCVAPPVLVGQAGRCALVLAPQGAADEVLTAIGADGECWRLALGRADSRPQFDATSDVAWWHAEATLHVLAIDRADGAVRWRRKFGGANCYPRAHVADVGERLVVVHACEEGVALAGDGAERWRVKVDADAVAVVGAASVEPLLNDSPGLRHVQYVTAAGVLAGRIEVADGASAHAIAAGLVVQTREGLTLWDAQGGQRWWRAGGQFAAIGGYVVIKGSGEILEATTGRVLGRDPFDARPLAVVDGAPVLMVMHAGFLWARALP